MSGEKKSYCGEMFAVFHFHFCWYFHAMAADKVIDHLQFVEEGFFVERFASEIKPNRVKNFLVLDPGKVGFLGFFAIVFEAGHRFYDEAEPSKRSENYGVQSDTPGNH